jgi:hypothetical protein
MDQYEGSQDMTTPLPSSIFPIADTSTGRVTQVWHLFFAQFVDPPQPIVPITVGASPFSYQASGNGSLNITGGTVSSVTLKRGTITAVVNAPVRMANNDVVTITYSSLPTVSFVPG